MISRKKTIIVVMPLDSDFHINNHVSNYLKKEFDGKIKIEKQIKCTVDSLGNFFLM